MKLIKLHLVMAFCLGLVFVSCSDDEITPKTKVTIVALPSEIGNVTGINNLKVDLENINTGEKLSYSNFVDNKIQEEIEEGVYNISISGLGISVGKRNETVGNEAKEVKTEVELRGESEKVIINGETSIQSVELFFYNKTTGFVISEIFFTGTKTPEGTPYNGDQYFEIYNNSDKVLYADGLSIGISERYTGFPLKREPDLRNERVDVNTIFTIPGYGKEYPVQAGECILITDIAINHKENNPNSFDFSNADFEWYDEKVVMGDVDIDAPNVPNMVKTYGRSPIKTNLHNFTFESYILFKIDGSVNKFLTDNLYECTTYRRIMGKVRKITGEVQSVPNNIIIDAVSCGVPSMFRAYVLDQSLDISYTHSGDFDDARYGKSVKRKILRKDANGRVILLDSNDSASDFIPTAQPSPGRIEQK